MELELTKGWDGVNEFITDKPTEQLIAELVSSLDWQEFHAITLKIDDQNWVSVSGNQADDGLALDYEESGESTVADFEPETTADLIEILQLYLKGDQRFKKLRPRIFPDSRTKQQVSHDEQWRANYETKSKISKAYKITSLIIAVLIIGAIGSVLYLWSEDELRFVGHETDYTTATVTATRWSSFRGKSTQTLTYEFEYEGEQYKGYFIDRRHQLRHKVKDLLHIKFSKDDPNISKRIATLKRKE